MVPVNGCVGLLGQGRKAGGGGSMRTVGRVAGVTEDKDNIVMFQHPMFVRCWLCGRLQSVCTGVLGVMLACGYAGVFLL